MNGDRDMSAPVDYQLHDGALHCVFSGKLDTTVSMAIDADLQTRAADASTPVVFDLAHVNYVSSAFLRLCVNMAKRTPGFSVIHVDPSVKKVFKIAGFDTIMRIE
jgi:anti-anti-sigma factor